VLKEVEERVDDHITKMYALLAERGGGPDTGSVTLEHFNWLALHLVRKLTFSQIASLVSQKRGPDEDVGEDTVRKGVRVAWKLLNTRPQDSGYREIPVPSISEQQS
jgi:hypothetical protein